MKKMWKFWKTERDRIEWPGPELDYEGGGLWKLALWEIEKMAWMITRPSFTFSAPFDSANYGIKVESGGIWHKYLGIDWAKPEGAITVETLVYQAPDGSITRTEIYGVN